MYISVAVLYEHITCHNIGTETDSRIGISASLLTGLCTKTEGSPMGPLMGNDVISPLCHHPTQRSEASALEQKFCRFTAGAEVTELACSVQQHRLAFVPMNWLPSGQTAPRFDAACAVCD